MFQLIFGLHNVRDESGRPRRILIVGDDPAPCASLSRLMSRVHDFETIVVEVDDASLSGEKAPSSADSSTSGDPYTIHVPIDCIFAEIRRRNWYRGRMWDFFTSHGAVASSDDASDITTIYGVHVTVYITSYSEYRTGFRGAVSFFNINRASAACKFLVIDVSLPLEACALDAEKALVRFMDCCEGVRVYKINLEDELRSTYVCQSILDEAIGNMSQTPNF
ncbi:hypothetical protein X943_002420 [Babesia divergens]|uniref:Uncharacterized protein n=1 Tax=Babesia divergens TaxID=32595 RepID=A0AAD9GJP9_BABDI|nr:hypothetical protein X943_002420 [Babesia divergens]